MDYILVNWGLITLDKHWKGLTFELFNNFPYQVEYGCFPLWSGIASATTFIPYCTYYKPMGDLPYINSEKGGGLIIRSRLIYEYTICKHPMPYDNFELKRGWAYNTAWAYNIMYYTVYHLCIIHISIAMTIFLTAFVARYEGGKDQGRIDQPKAARGHATSNSANRDSIVLKDRGPCAACKTAHTIEVLISIFYMYTLSVSTWHFYGTGGPTDNVMQRTKNLNSKLSNVQYYAVYMCCMPSHRLWRLDASLEELESGGREYGIWP